MPSLPLLRAVPQSTRPKNQPLQANIRLSHIFLLIKVSPTVLQLKMQSNLQSVKMLCVTSLVMSGNGVSPIHQGSNPFNNEKPYAAKKRAVVCNLVRNIIQSDISIRVPAQPIGSKSEKKTTGQIRFILSPAAKDGVSKDLPQEPKSEASTPRNGVVARLFSARKQSHERTKPGAAADSSVKKENGKLTIKNITIKRAPSLASGVGNKDSEKPLILGSRRSSKEQDKSEVNKKPQGDHAGKGAVVVTTSTSEFSTTSGSFVKFNDAISQEREQLIQYNKLCNCIF